MPQQGVTRAAAHQKGPEYRAFVGWLGAFQRLRGPVAAAHLGASVFLDLLPALQGPSRIALRQPFEVAQVNLGRRFVEDVMAVGIGRAAGKVASLFGRQPTRLPIGGNKAPEGAGQFRGQGLGFINLCGKE